ncbi:MAG: histidine phosphatase family protein [Pseudohongiellaceae bacterium]
MTRIILLLAGLALSGLISAADQTTIYLVRHAEKVDSSTSSDLTDVGKARAKTFARMLHDKNLSHIFSTPFVRTKNTAAPTAHEHGLSIEEYDPDDGIGLVEHLKTLDEVILVTGHSNTIPGLVNLLTGESFSDLDERVYDKVYVVTLEQGEYTKLEILHTSPRTPL